MRISRAALVAVGLLVGLLLGEGLLAQFAPQVRRMPRIWQYDATLGWAHVPGAVGTMVTPEFRVEMAINTAGLRDREIPRERPPGGWRLVALGDSFVEGWGVALEASVSKQLEQRLQAMAGTAVEVINMGVAGYGTDQELLFYERAGRDYHPDDVLLFFYANDLWNNWSAVGIGSERGYKPFFRTGAAGSLALHGVPVPRLSSWDPDWAAQAPWRWRLDRHLEQHWHCYALAKRALFPPMGELGQRQDYYEGLYGLDAAGRWQSHWELSGRLLDALDKAVRRDGARLHVIHVPALVQIDDTVWERTLRRNQLTGRYDRQKPGRQLAALAARYGLRYLDLGAAFREEAVRQALFLRDSHWSAAGHALAAATIAERLLAERDAASGRRASEAARLRP